jgi:methylamine dehydrogenase heavy chain
MRTGSSALRQLARVAWMLCLASSARAELAPDPTGVSETVGTPSPHWTFYLDFELSNFHGRFVLIDGDDAEFLAHISAGQMPSLAIAPDASEVYVAETTYSYGSRGPRHDIVTVYDTTHYAAQAHIELPTGKRALMSALRRMTLLGDPRFLAIYNYTPATSLSIVDLEERRHVAEAPAPGCHLAFPTGERGVSMLCGDGTMATLVFDERGELAGTHRSERFFDPDADPIKTNAVRIGSTWYFVSYSGDVYPVDLSGEKPVFEPAWALVDHEVEPAGWLRTLLTLGKAGPWKPGGMQLAAGHDGRKELYVIMHPIVWSEGKGDHDFPGPEIWVFDVERKRRVRRLPVRGVAISVGVTQDAKPLLLVSGVDIETEDLHLEIYDAISGEFLREMFEYGDTVLAFEPVLGGTP